MMFMRLVGSVMLMLPNMSCVKSDGNLPTPWVQLLLGMLDCGVLSACIV